MITVLELRPYPSDDDIVVPSPNQGARTGATIEGIVLHATADAGNEAGTLTWLRSPKSGVSCHLLVSRTGRVTRLVGDQHCAWHAGLAWWRGTSDVNSITLGIEIANRNDGEPYTDAQYHRVATIVAHYCRQGLSLDDVVSHGAIAEERRTDPLGWKWDRFRAMVQEQLRAPEVDGDHPPIYDRRSTERGAGPLKQLVQAFAPPTQPAPTTATPKPRVPAIIRGKRALCSRTLWLNGLTVLAAGSGLASETLQLPLPVGLTPPDEITLWALLCIGVVNVILRLETTCPIGTNQRVDRTPAQTTIRVPRSAPSHSNGKAVAGPR